MDLEDVEYQLSKAKLLGSKGTTGTQASFLELFEGDHEKCRELDRKIAEKMRLHPPASPVSGQTYSRKLDSQMLSVPLRHRPERRQVLQRHPAAAAFEGSGRAL